MSNPQTFYTVGGVDLSNIFQHYTSGSQAPTTGYKIPNGADLNTIFEAYTSGAQASATGYKVGLSDLNLIFAPSVPFTTTGTSQYVSGYYIILISFYF